MEPSADTEVTGVVDGGLGPEGLALFVVLLDLGVLVVDVKRRGDPNGYDPGAKASGCATGHAPRKDQGDLIGAPEVQVVTDHLLEEHPSGEWAVEHLGEGELGLEDRDVVAVAGPAVLPGEGVGQAGEPLASKRVDLVVRQSVTDLLEALLVLTGCEAVVEGLEVDAGMCRLALGPLVAVDALPELSTARRKYSNVTTVT